MLDRKIADTGFTARAPSGEAFGLIFSKAEGRVIRQGAITYVGRQWHRPAIDHLPVGAPVEILAPLRKRRDRLFVRYEGKDLEWAEPLPVFQHGNRDGARLQSRLERGRRNAVRELKTHVAPSVSSFEFQKQGVEKIAPNAPAPEHWSYAVDQTTVSTVAEREAAEDARRRADMEEFLARTGGMNRGASGATH